MPKNSRALSLFIVLILVGLSAAAFFILSRERNVTSPSQNSPVEPAATTRTDSTDTSGWKLYTDEELGYQFKYPPIWKFEKSNYEEPDGKLNFRYVTLKADDFTVSVGIKSKNKENKLYIRPWRTGIPAGDFEKGSTIAIAGGTAEEHILIYRGPNLNDGGLVQLLWLCKVGDSLNGHCNNFDVKDQKEAFIEVTLGDNSGSKQWNETKKLLETFFQTINVI